jgi:ATP/maltotriose-dependent transcriptional regulator MalT
MTGARRARSAGLLVGSTPAVVVKVQSAGQGRRAGSVHRRVVRRVVGRSDSASVLAELENSNLFVVRLDHRGWWRTHPSFAEFVGFELASVEPGAAVELHRRAAGWFRSRAQ